MSAGIKIADVFNIENRGKVIVYTECPDDCPVIKIGDRIVVSRGFQDGLASVKGIEMINDKDPVDHKPNLGGLLIEWVSDPIADENLRGSVFTKAMNPPPPAIDGAQVLEFACSSSPFGVICDTEGNVVEEIYGLAICRYSNSGVIYRFSCNRNWETAQDAQYDSIEEAKSCLPMQYQESAVIWQKQDAAQQGDESGAANAAPLS